MSERRSASFETAFGLLRMTNRLQSTPIRHAEERACSRLEARTTRHRIGVAAAASSLCLMCACASVSSRVGAVAGNVSDRLTPVDARIWRPGVTRDAQLVDALGPPAERSFLPTGDVLLVWRSNVGVRTSGSLTYGFVVSPLGVLVRRASAAELHAPAL